MSLRSPLFILILLLYLLAGGLYASLTPAWQAPDEPAHYNYIRYLATALHFPELVMGCYDQTYLSELTARRFAPELSIDSLCYEFHQPPLYYLLATPLFWLSDGALLAIRLFSVLLGAGVVTLAFFIGRTIFPDHPAIAYGTMAFVAFVPMHVAILASVNNDALAELLFAAILLILAQRLMRNDNQPSVSSFLTGHWSLVTGHWSLGLLLGLGLITKTTIYIAIPLIALALWLERVKDETKRRTNLSLFYLGKQAAMIYGLALLMALPWYSRNALLYGNFDILGLIRHDEIVVGQLRTADYLAEVGWSAYLSEFITTTFRSFWGQFGWMAVPMDGRTYQLLTILTLIAVGGLVGFTIYDLRFTIGENSNSTISAFQKQALGLMALTIVLVALVYIGYNLTFKQLQGRYLFPAIIPLALFFSLGLWQAVSARWAWQLAGGLTLALIWVSVTSLRSGSLDKWMVLIVGLALGLAIGQAVLARAWPLSAVWLATACYAGLALLALLGPFWFVAPYLSF